MKRLGVLVFFLLLAITSLPASAKPPVASKHKPAVKAVTVKPVVKTRAVVLLINSFNGETDVQALHAALSGQDKVAAKPGAVALPVAVAKPSPELLSSQTE